MAPSSQIRATAARSAACARTCSRKPQTSTLDSAENDKYDGFARLGDRVPPACYCPMDMSSGDSQPDVIRDRRGRESPDRSRMPRVRRAPRRRRSAESCGHRGLRARHEAERNPTDSLFRGSAAGSTCRGWSNREPDCELLCLEDNDVIVSNDDSRGEFAGLTCQINSRHRPHGDRVLDSVTATMAAISDCLAFSISALAACSAQNPRLQAVSIQMPV